MPVLRPRIWWREQTPGPRGRPVAGADARTNGGDRGQLYVIRMRRLEGCRRATASTIVLPADPYAAKGVGEVTILPPTATIANASDSATHRRLTELPIRAAAHIWRRSALKLHELMGDSAKTPCPSCLGESG